VTLVNKTGEAFEVEVPNNISADPDFLVQAICKAWEFNGGGKDTGACEDARRSALRVVI